MSNNDSSTKTLFLNFCSAITILIVIFGLSSSNAGAEDQSGYIKDFGSWPVTTYLDNGRPSGKKLKRENLPNNLSAVEITGLVTNHDLVEIYDGNDFHLIKYRAVVPSDVQQWRSLVGRKWDDDLICFGTAATAQSRHSKTLGSKGLASVCR